MKNLFTILTMLLALYGLVMSIFVITENRRPQSTLAWILVLFFTPGIGLLIYLFSEEITRRSANAASC